MNTYNFLPLCVGLQLTFETQSKFWMNFVNNGWINVLIFYGCYGGPLLSACELPPNGIVNFVLFSWLLSPVFRSITKKAVQKLCVCILLSGSTSLEVLIDSFDKVLVFTVDSPPLALQPRNPFHSLGPVHEQKPMNNCCHPWDKNLNAPVANWRALGLKRLNKE